MANICLVHLTLKGNYHDWSLVTYSRKYHFFLIFSLFVNDLSKKAKKKWFQNFVRTNIYTRFISIFYPKRRALVSYILIFHDMSTVVTGECHVIMISVLKLDDSFWSRINFYYLFVILTIVCISQSPTYIIKIVHL